jgi:hypothetical protein
LLRAINLPHHKASAELGDILTIEGDYLTSDLTVRLQNAYLSAPLNLTPLPGTNEIEMQIQLPDTTVDPQVASQWVAGFYTFTAIVQRPGLPTWTTNTLSFALAPNVLSLSPTIIAVGDLPAPLTLSCIPRVRPEQSVSLLFANREIEPDSITTPADPTAETTVVFTLDDIPPGDYTVRLRVDGADSIPVIFSDTALPQFDDTQKVTITP